MALSTLSPAVARRLAAYAASAGIVLAIPPDAAAQVVYHDYQPDLVLPDSRTVGLDLDADGDDDFTFSREERYYHAVGYSSTCRAQSFRFMGSGANELMVETGRRIRPRKRIDVYYPYLLNLPSGTPVGPTAMWSSYAIGADEYCATTFFGGYTNLGYGNFHGEAGYAGFRFVGGDGQLHYGWMRLSGDLSGNATVFEYGYEATPDTPITAGAVSAALLDGSLNQTTFPPEGGTLVYTFTVTNTTDQPLPLDLWFDVERPAGVINPGGRLGSGTLPPGATVTRSMELRVGAGLPPRNYRVLFRLGDYATRAFITFEQFIVRKERGAESGASGAEGKAFAVAPVEGDLFANAAAEIAGTHTLSAPAPNPTTGRAEVTLRVADAQHVRVAVHDALGRRVALLHDGPMAAGTEHRLSFDGSELPAGVYVVRAVGEAFTDTRVLTLTR